MYIGFADHPDFRRVVNARKWYQKMTQRYAGTEKEERYLMKYLRWDAEFLDWRSRLGAPELMVAKPRADPPANPVWVPSPLCWD